VRRGPAEPGGFIWATRGRTWGFRFLRRGGFDDPLEAYERAFAGMGDASEAWVRLGDRVALRFADPEARQDVAGRVIPHEFVLYGPWALGIDSLEDGVARIWPEVAEEFARVWDQPAPHEV
jgi:hypothetical protein